MHFLKAKGLAGKVSFDRDTLIVPVVSTGNVGQLAVDLFLSSGRAESPSLVEKVGYLDTDLVAPAAGYEVFGPGQAPQLCVNLELHRFAASAVTVLQQRGPVVAGEEQAFAAALVEWARASGFKDILAVTGADAAEGLDPNPIGRGGMKRFRAGSSAPGNTRDTPSRPPCALEEALTNAGIKEFDLSGGGGMSLGGWPMAPMEGGALDAPNGSMTGAGIGLEMVGGGGDDVEEDGVALSTGGSEVLPRIAPLPTGTGIAGLLCAEASRVEEGADAECPLVVLLHFCSEGDNTPEAIEMAQAMNSCLKLLPAGDGSDRAPPGVVNWSSPLSWASLYGPPPSADAYQ